MKIEHKNNKTKNENYINQTLENYIIKNQNMQERGI